MNTITKLLAIALATTCSFNSTNDESQYKSKIFLKDGTSLQTLEDAMRTKYPHASIPPIRCASAHDSDITFKSFDKTLHLLCGKRYFNPEILIQPRYAKTQTAPMMEWLILHETGHSIQPGTADFIDIMTYPVTASAFALWGIHKKKPYRNPLTKISSKSFGAIITGNVFNIIATRLEEKRADRWANNVADAAALQGGIDFHATAFLPPNDNPITKIRYAIGSFILDSTHPSPTSRIIQCKKSLKARFGIES